MLFEFLFPRTNEQVAPPPSREPPSQNPIGAPTEMEPLTGMDRNSPTAIIAQALNLSSNRTRAARYDDFDAMDNSDIAAMLDAPTNAATTFNDARAQQGFKVEVSNKRAQKIVDDMLKRTRLQEKVRVITRETLKNADCFVEPIYLRKDCIRVQIYPVREMVRNQDDKGNLPTGLDSDGRPYAFQQVKKGRVIAGWKPWEMIHFKYWPDDRYAYSYKGLLDDLRADWRKLQAVELGMVTARVTRAYPRRVHMLDQTNKKPDEQRSGMADFINRLTRRKFGVRPTDVSTGLVIPDVSEDIYRSTGYIILPNGSAVPRRDETRTEDPAMAGLAELGDVTYLRQKLWSVVPSDTAGIRRNTSGDLDSQDLAYALLLRHVQSRIEVGVRAIIDQQLMAYGFVGMEFNVVFPSVIVGAAWKHADARFKDSLTSRNYMEVSAISRRTVLKRTYGLNDAEVDAEFDLIEKERQMGIFNAPATKLSAASNPDSGSPSSSAVTPSGIDRGSDLGKSLAGQNSA